MSNYRVKVRVYCAGRQYEPGDLCDENVALALGSDCEPVEDGGEGVEDTAPKRKTKPVKKVSIKSEDADEASDEVDAGE